MCLCVFYFRVYTSFEQEVAFNGLGVAFPIHSSSISFNFGHPLSERDAIDVAGFLYIL